MQFEINRELLIEMLGRMKTNAKSELPVHGCVKIQSDPIELTLMANDLHTASTEVLKNTEQYSCTTAGEILVDKDMLIGMLSRLRDDRITIDTFKSRARIKGAGSAISLATMLPDRLQNAPEPQSYEASATIDSEVFAKAFRISSRATADEARGILGGVLVTIETDGVSATASNGNRMSWSKHKCEVDVDEFNRFVILGEQSAWLARAARGSSSVLLQHSGNLVRATIESPNSTVSYVFPLLSGEYPAMGQFLLQAKERTNCFSANRQELLNALRPATLIDRDAIMLTVQPVGIMSVASVSDVAIARVSVGIQNVETDGNPHEIFVNHKYLAAALNAIDCEDVLIGFDSNTKPVLVQSLDNPEEAIELCMPYQPIEGFNPEREGNDSQGESVDQGETSNESDVPVL